MIWGMNLRVKLKLLSRQDVLLITPLGHYFMGGKDTQQIQEPSHSLEGKHAVTRLVQFVIQYLFRGSWITLCLLQPRREKITLMMSLVSPLSVALELWLSQQFADIFI